MNNTLTIWVPGPIPDPIAYNAGFKRLLKPGKQVVPNNLDFRRLLLKGEVEPMCSISSGVCGRQIFKQSEPKEERRKAEPSKSPEKD